MTFEIHQSQFASLASALGDRPETVQGIHGLIHGRCRAYVARPPDNFDAAVIQLIDWASEPEGYGTDPSALWSMLIEVQGWDCILLPTRVAKGVGEIMEGETGAVRFLEDVCYSLNNPVREYSHPSVRLLWKEDIGLLSAASEELWTSGFGSPEELLKHGIVAGAFIGERIVGTARTYALTNLHADIAVHTDKNFENRGFATAAASLVVQQAQNKARIPVWSAAATNEASLKIAAKLGFREVSRRTYVVKSS